MFEDFDQPAIRAIMVAQEEARRLRHNFVSCSFLFLGILSWPSKEIKRLLKDTRLDHRDARRVVEQIYGRGSGRVAQEIPFTPEGKEAVKAAWTLMRDFTDNCVTQTHLLIGLLDVEDQHLQQVLSELLVDQSDLKKRARELLE
ncbi:MAG TPA: Clp protease N-terminal domain-containing protein [Chroococcales cyanobacterium]